MDAINAISGTVTSAPVRDSKEQASLRIAQNPTDHKGDRVEISELASFLGRLSELPDNRARRIVDVRNAIQKESYVTPEKLSIASDRLLQTLLQSPKKT